MKNPGFKCFNNSKSFIEHSDDMEDVYKSTEEYNLNKRWKILFVFDDIIADMLSNKKTLSNSYWIIRNRKLNISLVFIMQSYFAAPKNFRLSSMHYFLMKTPSKWEPQQIAFNHSSDIDFQVFIKNDKWLYSCVR